VDGTVPSSKNLVEGTVLSSKNIVDGTYKNSGRGEGGRGRRWWDGAGEGRRNFPLLLLALWLGVIIEKRAYSTQRRVGPKA
jgi:hypothetical protein